MNSDDATRPAGWEGEGYAEAADHHRSFDDWFLDQHPPRSGDRIVDAGSGSGEFTATLAELVPDGSVVGVEPDPSMLEAARKHRADNLEFRRGRLQQLDEVCGAGSADLVVSRAVFHWIPPEEHRRCFEAIRRVLRPGGWFHAEWGGAGNVDRLGGVVDEVAAELGLGERIVTFAHPGAVLELLEEAGFEIPTAGVSSVAQRRAFTWEELQAFVRTQASVAYGAGRSEELLDRFVAEVSQREEELRRHDGSYDQTFVRIHVRCLRPD